MNTKLIQALGFLTGLVLPVLSLLIVFELRPELKRFQSFEYEVIKTLNVELITVGMLLNAAVFFLCLRFEKENFGRGILAATMVLLLGAFIYRFLL